MQLFCYVIFETVSVVLNNVFYVVVSFGDVGDVTVYIVVMYFFTAPLDLSCPPNINVQATAGQSGAIVSYVTPTVVSNTGTPPYGAVMCSQNSNTFFPSASPTNVDCSVTDAAGVTASCQFVVTVTSTTGTLKMYINDIIYGNKNINVFK